LRYPRTCRKEGELDLLLPRTGGQHHIEVRKDRDSGTAKKLGKFFSAAIQDTMDPTLHACRYGLSSADTGVQKHIVSAQQHANDDLQHFQHVPRLPIASVMGN